MSGAQSPSQVTRWSIRCRIELTFQVAIRMRRVPVGNRKSGSLESDSTKVESDSSVVFLFEHDLFGKPVSTFPDHALAYHGRLGEVENRRNSPSRGFRLRQSNRRVL